MVALLARWACWVLLVTVLGTIAGCPNATTDAPTSPAGDDQSAVDSAPSGGENGDSQRDEESPTGDASLVTDCGRRSVNTAPGPVYVAMSMAFETDVEPADAPLAKVLFRSVACWEDSVSSAPLMLYEVGLEGEVLAIISLMEWDGGKVYTRTPMPGDQRFEVGDGCLSLAYDADCVEFDLTHIPYGPCGLGWPVITRQGQADGEPGGDYICVTGTASHCSDCWVADGAWHNEVSRGGSYVALGSIEDVFVPGACGQPEEYVDIASGDRVQFSLAFRITYRMSASPEELGYEELELPTYP